MMPSGAQRPVGSSCAGIRQRMPSTIHCADMFGEVFICQFPFTSGAASKIRPALVLFDLPQDAIHLSRHFGSAYRANGRSACPLAGRRTSQTIGCPSRPDCHGGEDGFYSSSGRAGGCRCGGGSHPLESPYEIMTTPPNQGARRTATAHRLQEDNTLRQAGTLAGKIVLRPG